MIRLQIHYNFYLIIIEFAMQKTILYLLIIITLPYLTGCTDNTVSQKIDPVQGTTVKVTFLEFGANNCIPCLNMRPVMDSVQTKYGWQISVQYIDVYKNPKMANDYKIISMPTQVFLDSNETEFFRHRGFYPEDSIHILLKSVGLEILKK